MPIYTMNGKRYDIPKEQVEEFLNSAQKDGLEVSEEAAANTDFQLATAEETAPVVAETPVDTDLQLENGSSESQRKSVRGRVRKSDVQRRQSIFNEKVSNAEKGFYDATAVDLNDLYDETQKNLEEEFAIANKPVTKGTYMGSTYTYTPADEYTGAKKDMYDIYTSSGQVDLSDDYFAETLYKKKRALATTYIDDLPTDIKEDVEKNVEKDFGQVQEKVQSIETAIGNAVSIRSKFEAGEELTEDEIKEYKAFVASVPKLQEEYADAAAASKDASFALDYFKKSYKITDQIAAAFKTTGLEMASGVLEVGNMMAAEKDYQSSASKYVNDVLIAHQKDIEENLEAPISLDDLEASGDRWSGADTWAAQLFANQTPFLLAASTGTAAPYLFGAMGTTSRLSQFSIEEQTARENINRLEKELLEATDSFDIAAIKSDIKKNKNITKKNDGLKLLTSVGHGAAEMIDGYADKFLLGGIKKSWKRIGPDEFKASWKQAGKQYTAGVLTETGSESVTQVGQNAFDIWFDNADKSYFEGLDEAAAGGFVMGNGFKVTEFGGIARNIVANVAADKEQRAEVAALTEKLNGFRNIINDPNASEVAKQEATTQRQKTEKELIRLNDVTLARFEKLSFEDQKQVMEFDRQSRAVNKRWTRIAADNSLTDSEKDAMRVELEQEFNQAQEQKRAILQTTSPANLVSADKAKAGLFEEGDLVRELEDGNVSLQKVKAHNKKSGYTKAVVEVSDQALEDITNFVDEGNTDATIEVDDTKINFDQAVAIATQNEGRNGFYDPKSGVIAYMPQRGRSKGKSLAAVPLHEYMHAAFVGLGIPKSEFATIKEDLLNTIEDIDLPENKKNAIKQSIALYDQRISKRVDEGDITAKQAEEIGGEEIFNIIGDVIAQDVLRGNKKQDFLQRLSIRIKNLLNGKLDPEVIDGLNIDTAQGALEFVTRFQEDVTAGKTITKQTLTGTTTDEEAVDLGSEIVKEVNDFSSKSNLQGLLDKSNGKVSEFITNSMNDPNTKQFADNLLKSQFGQEIAPVLETLAKRNFDPIAKDATKVVSENYVEARNIWKNDLLTELISEVSNKYNPSEQNLDKFVTIRAYQRSNRTAKNIGIQSTIEKGGQGISVDIDKAKSVDSGAFDFSETDTRTIAEKLNLPQEILDKAYKLAELAAIKADKALEGKDISDLKKVNLRNKAFNEIFAKQLFKDIAVQLGKNTKKSSDFTNYINNNFEALRDIALTNIDFQKGGGPSADWNTIEPTQAEFLEYYEAKNEKTSTRSDRKKSLNNAIARAIANEARIEFAKRDPRTADLFKEKHGVVLASEIEAPANGPTKFSDMAGFKDGAGRPAQNVPAALLDKFGGEYNLSTETGQNELVNDLKKIGPSLPIEIIGSFSKIFPNHRMMKDAYKNSKNSKEGATEFARLKAQLKEKIETVVEEIKQQSTTKLEGAAQGWVARDFGKWLGNTPQDIKKSIESGRMREFNKSNAAMHEQVWKPLYEAIIKDKSAARLAIYLTPTSFGGAGWHRLGAEVIGYSQDPKGNGKKLYEWEHAMQANNARLFLVSSALSNVPFNTAYPATTNNYKVIALDAAADSVLKKANRGNSMGIGWDVYSGHWTQRYYSPDVAIFDGGLNPKDVTGVDGVTFDKKYSIDANGHSTKVMASEILNTDFNKMLERVKGVKAEARYSQDRANKLAGNKGKFKFFVPYSAEDYLGLVYPTLGKGKEGDRNLQWYKDNIVNPFAIGIANYEKAKVESLQQWRNLKKQVSKTPAKLNKEATRGFTNEEAVRVYLWNEQDVVPDTLAKKDVEALVKHVEDSKDLTAFAENVKGIVGIEGYPPPNENWISGSLTIDLIDNINTTKRSEFLQQWQDNVDVVYSKDNMNKLKAIYGERYTEALENILHRMKTGRNRPSGATRLENQFMNWINDSVGTVMFFNTRSALLQTISSVNFLNWSDNNPLMAGKAFANQPQFWKDFSDLFNSDFLKSRRSGLKNDINADELAKSAASSDNKVRAALSSLLKAGFLPTQIADSFAISIGGASFYRNRYNTYKKDGLSDQEAKDKAMLDFQETAEESQQSSRPDRVSMQQASGLGRVVLAFANTPMQYTRLTKKAALDLVNGRGDWKTNTSKILYYGAVQNIIFTALQQAMFAMLFDDDEIDDEEQTEASTKIVNGIADTFLRGSGVGGAAVATMKNIIMEIIKQKKSKRPDYTKAALKLTTLSPPVDTKIRKLMSAGRAFTYKQSLKDMNRLGVDIDNPAALATGQVLSAVANLPADRAILKMQNVKGALSTEHEAWQRIAMGLGFADWQLGIKDDKSKKDRPIKPKPYSGRSKSASGRGESLSGRSKKASGRTPNKRLERGVAGKAYKDGSIEVDPNLTPVEREKTIAHEKQHVEDMNAGKLNYDDNYVYWNGKKYPRKNGKIKYKGNWVEEGHPSLPWEKKAYDAEPSTKEIKEKKKRTKLY